MKVLLISLILFTTTACSTCWEAIEAVFPEPLRPIAHRVAQRESHEIATAKNRRSSASGCFQLTRIHADLIPGGWDQRFNPWANAVGALNLHNGSGWAPWAF